MTDIYIKCGNCEWFEGHDDPETGDCHVRPPGTPNYKKWPLVGMNDWCGEFKPKEEIKYTVAETRAHEFSKELMDEFRKKSELLKIEKRQKAKALAEKIRRDERTRIWIEINKNIKHGPLKGDGCDEIAQNNGVVIATNLVANMGINWEKING